MTDDESRDERDCHGQKRLRLEWLELKQKKAKWLKSSEDIFCALHLKEPTENAQKFQMLKTLIDALGTDMDDRPERLSMSTSLSMVNIIVTLISILHILPVHFNIKKLALAVMPSKHYDAYRTVNWNLEILASFIPFKRRYHPLYGINKTSSGHEGHIDPSFSLEQSRRKLRRAMKRAMWR